ncbi:MAG: hypothetical protein LC751_06825 [Actinobacteria bacterium]|nr:hypothetical protein [Actinomycetota bacterium]
MPTSVNSRLCRAQGPGLIVGKNSGTVTKPGNGARDDQRESPRMRGAGFDEEHS